MQKPIERSLPELWLLAFPHLLFSWRADSGQAGVETIAAKSKQGLCIAVAVAALPCRTVDLTAARASPWASSLDLNSPTSQPFKKKKRILGI